MGELFTLPYLNAAAMFLGIVMYALFGGADFGSGIYDLTAGDAQRGAAVRTLVDHSIGPVWEANHVWLIYVLVMWWTAFPTAFAASMTTLFVPMLLALLGIVARGAAFAFRKFAASLRQAQLFGAIFAGASLMTPFFLGAVAGAMASGRVTPGSEVTTSELFTSWLHPTSVFGGLIAVGTSAFLAGAFLTYDASRTGDAALTSQLRARTLVVSAVTGVIAIVALVPIRLDAPELFDGLVSRAAPLIVLSALAGIGTIALLVRRSYSPARLTAAVAVGSIVLGWAVGQYPWMLVGHLTITEAAGAPATLKGLLFVVALAGVVVLPPLVYLLRLTQSEEWRATASH